MSFDGYIRVSDVKGRNGERFISPTEQRAKIEGWATLHDLHLGEVVEELNVSGGKKIEDRMLGALLDKIEAGQSEGIICYRLNRFGRDAAETVMAAKRIREAGGRLVSVDDGVDSAQNGGKLVLTIMAGLAEMELDQRRENWDASKRRAIERGVATFKTPYGYVRDEDGRLVPEPEQAKIIRHIFQLKTEGKSLSAIEDDLQGTPTPSGGDKWTHSTVRQILRNRVYLGELKHGNHRRTDAHEPLVSEATFNLCQAVKPYREPTGHPNSNEALLAGIAVCAGCGYKLKIVSGENRPLRYFCKNAATKSCPERAYARADQLDPFAEAWFLDSIQHEGIIAEALQASESLSAAQTAVTEAEAELDAYVTTASALEPSLFQKGAEARQAKLDEARKVLAEARSKTASVSVFPEGDLLKAWPTLTVLEKRRLFGSLVSSVVVSKGTEPLERRVGFVTS